MGRLELSQECSGVCQANRYWFERDLSEGVSPPKRGCAQPLKDIVYKKIGALSVALIAAGVFSIFTLLSVLVASLCCRGTRGS